MAVVDEKTKKELKKEIARLMKIPGKSRTAILRSHIIAIRFKEGEGGVRKVEELMKELGYPINLSKIGVFGWEKDSWPIAVGLVAAKIFGWTDKDVFELGELAVKRSLLAKITLRHFLSPKKAFKEAPRLWKKYYNFGKLEPVEFNEKEKYLVLRTIRPRFHPSVCIYQRGYLTQIAKFVFGTEKIKVEETKCEFRGDPYHEYVIHWSKES